MTTCETIRRRLTEYLDGELDSEHGSVVRGHLRECAGCRQVARDEAALRDGLRTLPPVDPPASLWSGVQAQLAAAEVADARRPRWRRRVARWARWAPWPPTMSQTVAGGLLAAAAAVMLTWRVQRVDDAVAPPVATAGSPRHPAAAAPVRPGQSGAEQAAHAAPSADDVTADLIAEPARTTQNYALAIEELMTLATTARTGWSAERSAAFDGKLAILRDSVGRAALGRAQQRAQRALIRFLQGAIVRDDIVLASGGAR
jgi:hypothetical protein